MGLLVNTLAAQEKDPVLNRENLTMPIQMQLSQKQKFFSEFFAVFLKSSWNFKHFEKRISLKAFVFPKLRTLKTWLDKCLKNLVSEDPSTRDMVNVPKHCWNLPQNTFFNFISHWQTNFVPKSLSYWDVKSWDCLLTHWLPMISILFIIENI